MFIAVFFDNSVSDMGIKDALDILLVLSLSFYCLVFILWTFIHMIIDHE